MRDKACVVALACSFTMAACTEPGGNESSLAPVGWEAPAGSHRIPVAKPGESLVGLGVETPITVEAEAYRFDSDPSYVITATLAVYPREAGALSVYNGWYAKYAFLSAVERFPVAIDTQAERFELGWPPMHALIVRRATRFVLVEGAAAIPEATRTDLLVAVARSIIDDPSK